MSFAAVSDLQLHYQTCGSPDAPALLLVHGSGGAGGSDWGLVLAGLAEHFHVLMPDCRGHGQTLDPTAEYSFSRLAADLAEFLRALGRAPAFVVGHSNGGNVALVMCAEQGDVVKRAVAMAANAHVSGDLLKYADGYWPEHIGPDWAAELAARHDPGRYPGYWRDLMRRTAQEIARAPNYTPEDLGRIRTPILVIQGENDAVNQPGGHAEFLYEHLRDSRLWLAAGCGHNVQLERPDDWLDRVIPFLLAP